MTTGLYARRWTPIVLTLALALVGPLARSPRAQTAVTGIWTTLPYVMPINPVHLALMHDGNVLVVAGSGNVAAETNYRAAVWDPIQGTIAVQPLGWDMFCNGMVTLPDGRVFVNGGNLQYDPFHGQPRNAAFDPSLGQFTDLENMAHGRWYPTTTVLGDGRVMTFSGLNESGGTNTTVEIYTPGSGWSPEYPGRLDAAALPAHAPAAEREGVLLRARAAARACSIRRRRRGRPSSRPRNTRARAGTALQCCCRSVRTTAIARAS